MSKMSEEQQELQDRSMDQRSQMDQEREISAQVDKTAIPHDLNC